MKTKNHFWAKRLALNTVGTLLLAITSCEQIGSAIGGAVGAEADATVALIGGGIAAVGEAVAGAVCHGE